MNRSICIHGHFYQPPRENPWLEEVELQDSAYPYHDWNKRITAECYAPNTASRILDAKRTIIDIVNNYAKISFNFGPTLLSWIERHEPDVYRAILEADRLSQERFSGHGSALAQVYNHMIMPLANERDKYTQVVWGIKDFERRFGRRPEGMWLAETAVDLETLRFLADQGIRFTILSPHQAHRIRKIGDKRWKDVSGGKIDPKSPYLCKLPDGKSISIFFYDGPIAHDIAFGELLNSGEVFAKRLLSAFVDSEQPQLVHTATDGETYGHHHHHGDMALAYCFYHLEANKLAKLTIYGEYLEKNPPLYEVEIVENSSWSCVHGVERWRSNCGCNTGMHPQWHQEWRAPLRSAMDWLRDRLVQLYEENMSHAVKDCWHARNEYIDVILDRSTQHIEQFLSHHMNRELSPDEKVKILKLLEMQRHAMLMYTSCGWFFDEISGIETVQVIQYAARAMQLAREVVGTDLESEYINLLKQAPSNIPEFTNGAQIYERLVKPTIIDLLRVGAHYTISSLFEGYPETIKIYCYTARSTMYDRIEMGKQKLAIGQANLHSDITHEDKIIRFAILHFGDHNLIGGVHPSMEDKPFDTIHQEIKGMFQKGDTSQVVSLLDTYFGTYKYSLWHLFKDEQREVMNQIIDPTLKEIETSFRQIYEHHYPIMQVMNEMRIPLPRVMATTLEFIYNTDLRKLLESEKIDFDRLQKLIEDIKRWTVELDAITLGFVASTRCSKLIENVSHAPEDLSLLEAVEATLRMLGSLSLPLNMWKAQNIYFDLRKNLYQQMHEKADQQDQQAQRWVTLFNDVGKHLGMRSS
jgi:alpha-amylase/alpha-mannosidase (GH57 family)